MSDAVTYWLAHGLGGRSPSTVRMYTTFAETHVLPALGARKLRDLSVEDVDSWLTSKKGELSTRSLKLIHGILNRAVKSAMRRDKVKRNVVDLCEIPKGARAARRRRSPWHRLRPSLTRRPRPRRACERTSCSRC
ncbi:tyrosine-type recombinase/integrase [Microbispora sp. NPDC004025]